MKETIQVEKEVYEAVLRNSVKVADLEAENRRLKKIERKKGKLVNENYKLKKKYEQLLKKLEELKKFKDEKGYWKGFVDILKGRVWKKAVQRASQALSHLWGGFIQ